MKEKINWWWFLLLVLLLSVIQFYLSGIALIVPFAVPNNLFVVGLNPFIPSFVLLLFWICVIIILKKITGQISSDKAFRASYSILGLIILCIIFNGYFFPKENTNTAGTPRRYIELTGTAITQNKYLFVFRYIEWTSLLGFFMINYKRVPLSKNEQYRNELK